MRPNRKKIKFTDTNLILTQNEITWTFQGTPTYGQYINGDYWVQGPVTILSVSPNWDGTKNGSMVNPDSANTHQGYDTRCANYPYDDTLRTSFPLVLTGANGGGGGDSLVSTIGLTNSVIGGAYESLNVASVLTIVESPPIANSFRPPYVYMSNTKPHWSTANVNYNLLPRLPDPPNISTESGIIPSIANNYLKHVMLDHGPLTWGATIHPQWNYEDSYYGPAYSHQCFAYCLLDKPDTNVVANRIIQLGIDYYGIHLRNGRNYMNDGGYNINRKWPILFAGIMLNDTSSGGMQQPISVDSGTGFWKFPEDGYTYYGIISANNSNSIARFGEDAVLEGFSYPYYGNHNFRDPEGILEPKESGVLYKPHTNFTGNIAGNVLTVTSPSNGTFMKVSTFVTGTGVANTSVTQILTGTGNVGTYRIDTTQTIASQAMIANPQPSGGYMQCCTSKWWIGEVLAAKWIANSTILWNHNAFFDYIDRFTANSDLWTSEGFSNDFQRDSRGYGGDGHCWMYNMWSEYGNGP